MKGEVVAFLIYTLKHLFVLCHPFMLDHAADVNGRDKEGRTALHLAVDSEMEPLVRRLLVDRGAEINTQDDQGHSALSCHWA